MPVGYPSHAHDESFWTASARASPRPEQADGSTTLSRAGPPPQLRRQTTITSPLRVGTYSTAYARRTHANTLAAVVTEGAREVGADLTTTTPTHTLPPPHGRLRTRTSCTARPYHEHVFTLTVRSLASDRLYRFKISRRHTRVSQVMKAIADREGLVSSDDAVCVYGADGQQLKAELKLCELQLSAGPVLTFSTNATEKSVSQEIEALNLATGEVFVFKVWRRTRVSKMMKALASHRPRQQHQQQQTGGHSAPLTPPPPLPVRQASTHMPHAAPTTIVATTCITPRTIPAPTIRIYSPDGALLKPEQTVGQLGLSPGSVLTFVHVESGDHEGEETEWARRETRWLRLRNEEGQGLVFKVHKTAMLRAVMDDVVTRAHTHACASDTLNNTLSASHLPAPPPTMWTFTHRGLRLCGYETVETHSLRDGDVIEYAEARGAEVPVWRRDDE